MPGLDLLKTAGLHYVPVSANRISVEGIYGARVFRPIRPPAPSTVERDLAEVRRSSTPNDVLLYLVDRVPDTLRERSETDEQLAYVSPSEVSWMRLHHYLDNVELPNRPTWIRRKPYGRLAVARVLLTSRQLRTQAKIAAEVGVTQAAVSGALAKLGDLVIKENAGWRAADPGALFDHVLNEYPGASGITSYWFGIDSLPRQRTLVQEKIAALASGDSAADTTAPWRKPKLAVVYAQSGVALAELGFAETDREHATLKYTVPADTSIWATAAAFYGKHTNIVDPVIAAFDIIETGGGDAKEAVQHLREVTIKRWTAL